MKLLQHVNNLFASIFNLLDTRGQEMLRKGRDLIAMNVQKFYEARGREIHGESNQTIPVYLQNFQLAHLE